MNAFLRCAHSAAQPGKLLPESRFLRGGKVDPHQGRPLRCVKQRAGSRQMSLYRVGYDRKNHLEALGHLRAHLLSHLSQLMPAVLVGRRRLKRLDGYGLAIFVHCNHGKKAAVDMAQLATANVFCNHLDANLHG